MKFGKKIKKSAESLLLIIEQPVLSGVGNNEVRIIGILRLQLNFEDVKVEEFPFAVVESKYMPKCCILGANFLTKNRMILDFAQNTIAYQNNCGHDLIYPLQQETNFGRCYAYTVETPLENNNGNVTVEESKEIPQLKLKSSENLLELTKGRLCIIEPLRPT